jgi:hypothetical protein
MSSSRAESISNSSHLSSYDSSLSNSGMNNNSSGKPSVTLIHTPQQSNWQQQSQPTYVMAQKPSNGKPISNLSQQQSSAHLNLLINRVKDPSMDEQQRSDINEPKQQQQQQQPQPMFSSLINKTPVNRLQSSTFIQPQQQWYSTTPQQQFTPPPNYTAATRARYTPVMPQPTPNQSSPQTHLAPLRSNASTPPPNYITRTSSTPNMTRPPLIRPSQFPSQPPQDPSAR